MISAGMDMARLAFSYGDSTYHALLIERLRQAAEKTGKPVAIMQDLQGPRFRVGILNDEDGLQLQDGERVILVAQSIYDQLLRENKQNGDLEKIVPMSTPSFFQRLQKGQDILINDGLIVLVVERTQGERIYAKVHRGGQMKSHKSINIPHMEHKAFSLTEKDKKDISFGIKHNVDFIALSFVKSAKDIRTLQEFLSSRKKRKQGKVQIIAKIEQREAIEKFDEILQAADGIMIARGDLGLELSLEEVPVVQKQLILASIAASKPIIVATQMLESMIDRPLPNRAEISDIANAVIDHCDATMLSGETSLGKYPVECVRFMDKTILKTERSVFDDFDFTDHTFHALPTAISTKLQMLSTAWHTPVIVISNTLEPLRILASLRMERKIVLVCSDARIARQCMLYWGGEPYVVKSLHGAHPSTLVASLRRKRIIPARGGVLVLNDQYVQIYP